MKLKSLNSKVLSVFVLCSLFFAASLNSIEAASKCYTKGVEQYCVISSDAPSKSVAIDSTRANHNPKDKTAIGFSSASSVSMSASSTITATVGIPANTISASLGVSASISHSWVSSVTYTLDSNRPAGVYYIKIVFPGSKLTYRYSNSSTQVITNQKIISYAPRINASYKDLAKA